MEILDSELISAFGELRGLRRPYLHFMIDPAERDVDSDACRAYQLACKLVTKTLDVKFATGAVVLPPKVMRFIQSIVKTNGETMSCSDDGQEDSP